MREAQKLQENIITKLNSYKIKTCLFSQLSNNPYQPAPLCWIKWISTLCCNSYIYWSILQVVLRFKTVTVPHVIRDLTETKTVKMKESPGVTLADLTAAALRTNPSSFSRKNVGLQRKHGCDV